MRKRTRALASLATVIAAALMAFAWIRLSSPPDPRERLRTLREELAVLRASADSCLESVTAEERSLRAQREGLDSLRERVRAFESLDPRGVPADRYDEYMESFERYNQEAGGWPAASETLQAHWRACRAIAGAHNALADSALAVARELGLVTDTVEPVER